MDSLHDRIEALAKLEEQLTLPGFTADDSWELGSIVRDLAMAQAAPVAIEIWRGAVLMFRTTLHGATDDNATWLRRKIAVTTRFERSSFAMRLILERDGLSLENHYHLPARDYIAGGGAVPIRVAGVGVVGAIAMSGLTGEEDHELVVQALRAFHQAKAT